MHRLDKQMRLRSRSLIAAIGLLAAAISASFSSAHAQDKTSNHTMPSGPDVWRVELRNYNQFYGRGTGVTDRDRQDEIHSVRVELKDRFATTADTKDLQYHRVRETASNMASELGAGNSAYVKRRFEHTVSWTRQPRQAYNLWVHTRQFAEEHGAKPSIFFAITVDTIELDCRRRNICGRKDYGHMTFLFKVPPPTKRSSTCIPENSYKLESKISGPGSVWTGAVFLTSMSDSSKVFPIPMAIKRSMPEMFIKSAEICIASTSK